MPPIERARKLRSEWQYSYGKAVIENMIMYNIGINNPPFQEYWEQVLIEYEKL